MQATRERIRIACDHSKSSALVDKLTGDAPDFWRGTDIQFELGLFYGATLLDDVANIASIRLLVREKDNLVGTIFLDKTISPPLTIGDSCTADSSTDKITRTAHGFADTDKIFFTAGGMPAGLTANTTYYVRDATTNDFKVAATSGGAAIDITSNGSAVLVHKIVNTTYWDNDTAEHARISFTNVETNFSIGDSCTADSTTDKISRTTHGFSNGDKIFFTATTMPTGLTANTTYYVRDATTDDFKVAATSGGAAIDFSTNGSGIFVQKVTTTSREYLLSIIATTSDSPGREIVLGTSILTVRDPGDGSGSSPPAGDPGYYTKAESDSRFVNVTGDTMTGELTWSGSNHLGLLLLNISTTNRDLLTPSFGHLIYNVTANRLQLYDNVGWREYVIRAGDTLTGLLQFSGTGHAGLKLNSLTTTQRDALSASAGMLVYNTSVGALNYYDTAWRTIAGRAGNGIDLATSGTISVIISGSTTYTANRVLHTGGTTTISTGNLEYDGTHLRVANAGILKMQRPQTVGFSDIMYENAQPFTGVILRGEFTNVIGGAQAAFFAIYTTSAATLAERWRVTESGILQSNGAQTIQSTGQLDLKTAALNGNIVLTPHGSGQITLGSTTNISTGSLNMASLQTLRLAGSGWILGDNSYAKGVWFYCGDDASPSFKFRNAATGADYLTIANGGKVGIGTIPLARTSILDSGTLSTPVAATVLQVQASNLTSTSCYLNIISGTAGGAGVFFGDTASVGLSWVLYDNSINALQLAANGNACINCLSTAGYVQIVSRLCIGSNDPNAPLDVRGNGLVTGKLGLAGVTSPTYDLSFQGNSARTLALERHTTSNTAGNSLTVQAGGAASGATDKAGGALKLSGGISTGTGESALELYVYPAGTTGTADNAQTLGAKLTHQYLECRAGRGTQFARVAGVIFVDATDRGNVGTGEDDLSTFTLPADTLKNAKDRIVGRAVFKTANNGNVKNMRLYVGSNLIYTISTTLALETFVWDFEIIVDATNSIRVWARSTRNGGVNTTYTTASVTLSSNQTIKFTGEGTSDNDLVQKTMSLQFTPAI